jgi:hypothetical protein
MRWAAVWAVAIVLSLGVIGCREGGDEGCSVTEHEDISGSWTVEAKITASTCDPEGVGTTETEIADVTQDGGRVEIELMGDVLSGSICGDSFSARLTESDELSGCTMTQTSSTSGSVDGDTIDAIYTTTTQVADTQACADILELVGLDDPSCSQSMTVTGAR